MVSFERNACALDKDFQLYFVPKAARIGVSMLTHAPVAGRTGLLSAVAQPAGRVPDPQRAARPRDRGRHVGEHGTREAATSQGGLEPRARLARARRPIRTDRVRHHAHVVPRAPLGDRRRRSARGRSRGSSNSHRTVEPTSPPLSSLPLSSGPKNKPDEPFRSSS